MRSYELTVIYKTDEEQYRRAKAAANTTLLENGAEITKEEELGERALATAIKGDTRARYVFYALKLEQQKIPAIEKVFKLDKGILKYLFVREE